jgi:hypothetical protein
LKEEELSMLSRFRRISLILFGLALMAQSPSPAPPAKTSLAIYPIKPAGASPYGALDMAGNVW